MQQMDEKLAESDSSAGGSSTKELDKLTASSKKPSAASASGAAMSSDELLFGAGSSGSGGSSAGAGSVEDEEEQSQKEFFDYLVPAYRRWMEGEDVKVLEQVLVDKFSMCLSVVFERVWLGERDRMWMRCVCCVRLKE